MKTSVVAFFVLLGIFGFSSARDSVVVESGDSTHFRAYEADWFPSVDPRIVILKGEEITKESSNDYQIDALEFLITNFNQTAVYFAYFHEEAILNNISNPNSLEAIAAAAFAFYIRAYIAFEYVDYNGISGYQPNTTDTFTGYYDLSSLDLPWRPMDIESYNVTDSSTGQTVTVWSISMQTLDEVFLMRFTVVGAKATVSGVQVDADTMKIDFEVRWFTDLHVPEAWTTGPSDPSAHPTAQVGLAIVAIAVAEEAFANTTAGNNDNNPQLAMQVGEYAGVFSWETSAGVTIQGVEDDKVVYAEVQDSAGSYEVGAEYEARLILFTFEGSRPSLVSWDPEVSAKIPGDDQNSASSTSTSASTSTTTEGEKSNSAMNIVPAIATLVVLIAILF